MDCSTPGFPVFHHLPELAQTHVHWVGDAIQPSHPLSPPSPPAFNLSQHQGLFQWVGSLHQMAKVLELKLLASVLPMNIQGWFPLGSTGLICLQSKGLNGLLQHHNLKASIFQCSAFFMVQLSHPYMTIFSDISVANIFSLSINCLFVWLIISFVVQNLFGLISCIYFCFDFPCLRWHIQNILLRLMSKRVLP